jgi:hypothetical protein
MRWKRNRSRALGDAETAEFARDERGPRPAPAFRATRHPGKKKVQGILLSRISSGDAETRGAFGREGRARTLPEATTSAWSIFKVGGGGRWVGGGGGRTERSCARVEVAVNPEGSRLFAPEMLTVPPLPSSNSVADWPAIIRRRALDILHLPWRSRAMRLTLKRDEKPLRVPWAGHGAAAERFGRGTVATRSVAAEAPRANSSAPRGSETRGRRRGALVAAGPGNGRERCRVTHPTARKRAISFPFASHSTAYASPSRPPSPPRTAITCPPFPRARPSAPRSPRTARASARVTRGPRPWRRRGSARRASRPRAPPGWSPAAPPRTPPPSSA